MKILKSIGILASVTGIILGGIGIWYLSLDAKNVSELPFMFIAGLSLLFFFSGIIMVFMSRKGDPFEQAIAAISEGAEAGKVDSPNAGYIAKSGVSGQRPDSTSPAAIPKYVPASTLAVIEQLMASNEQLKKNNAELQAMNQKLNTMQPQPQPEELSFEEELERDKKAYYESLKAKPAPQPLSIQESNAYYAALFPPQSVKLPPSPQEIVDQYIKDKAEFEKQATTQKALLEKAAEPLKPAGPAKVKVKFELPFFGKKKSKLKSILDEEEQKLEQEEAIGRQKYGA